MKVLSIRQPWAFAITMGVKDIENRDWKDRNIGLRFRGKFLIHASLREEKDMVEDVLWDMVEHGQDHMSKPYLDVEYAGERLGAIVGAATVVDVVRQSSSPWFFGPIGLVLSNPVRCMKPVDCKGMLGFFNCPPDVQERLHIPGYIENGKEVA